MGTVSTVVISFLCGDELASDDFPAVNKFGQLGDGSTEIDGPHVGSADNPVEKSVGRLAESDDPVLSHKSSSSVGAAGNRSDSGRGFPSPPSPEPTEEDPHIQEAKP